MEEAEFREFPKMLYQGGVAYEESQKNVHHSATAIAHDVDEEADLKAKGFTEAHAPEPKEHEGAPTESETVQPSAEPVIAPDVHSLSADTSVPESAFLPPGADPVHDEAEAHPEEHPASETVDPV